MSFARRYLLAVVLGLFVGAAILSSACSQRPAEERAKESDEEHSEAPERLELGPPAIAALKLAYATAEERELVPWLETPAEIIAAPDRRATISSRVAGRVVEVRANSGDSVKAGVRLVVLESDEVGRARADLLAATARAEVARLAARRQRRLLEDRIASNRAVEEAEGELRVAQAELEAIRARLRTFGVAPEAGSVRDPARVEIASPIAGRVMERAAYVGQWVEPSHALLEVVDLTELWLSASVYEREIRTVREGQAAEVEVRAFPGESFSGTVARVAATLDERTRSMSLRIVLPNPGERLKPGMFATARVRGVLEGRATRALAVPAAAVQEIDGQPVVFVHPAERSFEIRSIAAGERVGDLVEVRSGLSSGEEVVTEGSLLLKGQFLRGSLGEEEEE